jgi:hypothetical protein
VSAGCGEQAVPDAAIAEQLLVDLGPNRGIGRAKVVFGKDLLGLGSQQIGGERFGSLARAAPVDVLVDAGDGVFGLLGLASVLAD